MRKFNRVNQVVEAQAKKVARRNKYWLIQRDIKAHREHEHHLEYIRFIANNYVFQKENGSMKELSYFCRDFGITVEALEEAKAFIASGRHLGTGYAIYHYHIN